jgi:AAA family ATP:ADP antiporter
MDINAPRDSFSTLRSWMFPVYRNELKKVLPLGLMMVLISFNFWLLHISKDTLVISAEHSGAEIINFLKIPIFVVSIFLVMIFTWISNRLQQKTIFFIIVSVFLAFFLFFNYIIYPNKDAFHLMSPDQISSLKIEYPWFKWVFPVIGYWSYSLFYIMSELWGVFVLSLLFWQFANQITTVEQSRRFYMLLGMFNGIGTIFSGFFITNYEAKTDIYLTDAYGSKLHNLLLIFCISCALILVIYYWTHKLIVKSSDVYRFTGSKNQKNKIKLSFVESFKYILKSRYVGYIAIISIAYNISINFVEVTWKSQVKELYQSSLAIEYYFSKITICMGFLIFFTGFFGAGFVRRFSWRCSSLVTPIAMAITSILFFMVTLWQDSLGWLAGLIGMTPIALSVYVGQIHNLASRTCKYSFFAATKEMAFIPLDAELKVKGKAAVDILSGRVGKFGGSVAQSMLLSVPCLATQFAIAPYLLGLVTIVFFIWVLSINLLNKEFLKVAYGSHAAEPESAGTR